MGIKTISFSEEEVVELKRRLNYNPKTGDITYKVDIQYNAKKGQKAGSPNEGYVQIRLKGRFVKGHRIAWLFHHGYWPENDVDHIDGNRSNNAISNLRLATRGENTQNQKRAQATNKLGIMGVCIAKGNKKNPYVALISQNGKQIYLGYYPTSELAHAAYIAKKREIHPFFVEAA